MLVNLAHNIGGFLFPMKFKFETDFWNSNVQSAKSDQTHISLSDV